LAQVCHGGGSLLEWGFVSPDGGSFWQEITRKWQPDLLSNMAT
jgi:hypothetical protein